MSSLCGAALRAKALPLGWRLLSAKEIRHEVAPCAAPDMARDRMTEQLRGGFLRPTGAPDAASSAGELFT
jgi:hypothetical protein